MHSNGKRSVQNMPSCKCFLFVHVVVKRRRTNVISFNSTTLGHQSIDLSRWHLRFSCFRQLALLCVGAGVVDDEEEDKAALLKELSGRRARRICGVGFVFFRC